jgi:hypothetical protein
MGRRRGKRSLPTPEELISGRRQIGVGELVKLIHRVNPTDRGLPEDVRDERYRMKAALQSLLLREHRALMLVEADPGGDDDLVLLRLRSGRRDAGHTFISQLDDDVKAWVREQLHTVDDVLADDAGAGSGLGSGRSAGTTDPSLRPGTVLEQGRQALEAYDYELARDLLRRAVRERPGDVDAAGLLIELLVDHLAAWREALALEPSLHRPAKDHPRIVEPLARAAARIADVQGALRRVRGLPEDHRVAVLVLACEAHLRAGAMEDAQSLIEGIRSVDPAEPSIPRLETSLAEQRALAREPEEQELERLLEGERWDDLVAGARALLERWPRSVRGRRLLSLGEERLRARERDALTGELREALAREELERAERVSKRLAPFGGAPAALREQLASALEGRRQAEVEARALVVTEALERGDDIEAALMEYLGLPNEARALVRERTSRPEPGWLEALGTPGRGRRAEREVEAVRMLWRARQRFGRDVLDEAQGLIASCWPTVSSLEDAKRLKMRIEASLLERQRDALESLERTLHTHLDRGEPGAALAALGAVIEPPLHGDHAAWLGRLRDQVTRQCARADAIATAERLAAEQRWVELRSHLAGAGELVAKHLPADLQAFVDTLDARVQVQFRVSMATSPVLGIVDWQLPHAGIDPCGDVLPGGRSFLAIRCLAGWLVVREVDLDSGQLVRQVVLRPPQPFTLVDHQLAAEGLWFFGRWGEQLLIEPSSGAVLEWHGPLFAAGEEPPVTRAALAPGTRWLWLRREVVGQGWDRREWTQVVELGARRVHKELERGFMFLAIEGPDPARMALLDLDEGMRLYQPRGRPDSTVRPRRAVTVESVDWLGEGLGWLVVRRGHELLQALLDDGDEPDERLILERLDPRGEVISDHTIKDSFGEKVSSVVVSRSLGLVYLICYTGEGQRLEALELTERGGFESRWSTLAPEGATLGWDRERRHVLLLWPTSSGARWLSLGAEAPTIPPQDHVGSSWGLGRVIYLYCSPPPAAVASAALSSELSRIRSLGGDAVKSAIDSFMARHGDDPDALSSLIGILRGRGRWALAGPLLADVAQRHSGHGALSLLRAQDLADERAWRGVVEILEPIDGSSLSPAARAHRHHLLGIAWLCLNDLVRARRELGAAAAVEGGGCSVDASLVYCDLLEGVRKGGAPSEVEFELSLFIEAVRRADEHLERGEPAQAIRVLEHHTLWARGELQTTARRAWAWLQLEPEEPGLWAAKLIALGLLVERALGEVGNLAPDLPVPPGTWPRERIDDVAREAQAWLDRANLDPQSSNNCP